MEKRAEEGSEREIRERWEARQRGEKLTSTDPSTASLPPAEGRTDIGEPHKDLKGRMEEYRAGATTAPKGTNQHHLSKEPAEGRVDLELNCPLD